MKRLLLIVLFSLFLFGCDSIDTFTEGFKHAQAASTTLKKSLGVECFVGFRWENGYLKSVTVNYKGVPKDKSIQEIFAATKQVVVEEFKQTPWSIVVSFKIKP